MEAQSLVEAHIFPVIAFFYISQKDRPLRSRWPLKTRETPRHWSSSISHSLRHRRNEIKSEDVFSTSPISVASRRKWNLGFFSEFPLFGLGALALSLCCEFIHIPPLEMRSGCSPLTGTVAAIAIVPLSDGKPISEWSGNKQPGVLLAYSSLSRLQRPR